MIYVTGDTHRNFSRIEEFAKRFGTTTEDVLVILGDAGINYRLDKRDRYLKQKLSQIPLTLLCLRGNHEERPENIFAYRKVHVKNHAFEADCYVEDAFPNIYFLADGPFVFFREEKAYSGFAAGGAYSVDKYFRLASGRKWFADEQLSRDEMKDLFRRLPDEVDFVLTHTCPGKFTPTEMFIKGLDQSTVDRAMENFLDTVEEKLSYKRWYCGHWHCDKTVDKIRFVHKDIFEIFGVNDPPFSPYRIP